MKTYHKVLVTILLAVITFPLFGCAEPDPWAVVSRSPIEAKVISGNEPSQKALLNAYQAFNREYFYGGLPESKTTVKLTDNLRDISGVPIMGSMTAFTSGTFVIEIDRQSHALEKQAEMSLVHEMCHQQDIISQANEGLDGHSYAFEACMESFGTHGGFKGTW